MNLGDCVIHAVQSTIAEQCFNEKNLERHWHSYAVNMEYWSKLEQKGLIASVWDQTNSIVVGVEIKDHPFYVAFQFHPEFKSTYGKPRKIFERFVLAALDNAAQSISK